MNRPVLRLGAIAAAATLSLSSMAPAFGATVSQADATALTISVAGETNHPTGTVTATHDGDTETVEGQENPPVDILDNQRLASIGVLAQQATARVTDNRKGTSAACSGVAGDGGSLVQVGDSNCLVPGDQVRLTMSNLNLSGAELIDPDSALGALGEQLNDPTGEVLAALTGPLSEGLQEVPVEVYLDLGAVEARCVANPGSAEGESHLTDASLNATVGDEEVTLVELPTEPAPNTTVPTQTSKLLTAIVDALEVQLTEGLEGALSDLTAVTGEVQAQLIDEFVTQIETELAPIEENLLKLVLNKQERPEPGAIDVTALDLDVLPAAKEFADGPLVGLDLAQVGCGPSGRVAPPSGGEDPEEPVAPKPQKPEDKPEVPTVIASGVEGEPSAWYDGLLAPGVLLLLASSAGLIGYRRLTS